MSLADSWDNSTTLDRIDFMAGDDYTLKRALLKQAKDEGYLTKEEYQSQRQKIKYRR